MAAPNHRTPHAPNHYSDTHQGSKGTTILLHNPVLQRRSVGTRLGRDEGTKAYTTEQLLELVNCCARMHCATSCCICIGYQSRTWVHFPDPVQSQILKYLLLNRTRKLRALTIVMLTFNRGKTGIVKSS